MHTQFFVARAGKGKPTTRAATVTRKLLPVFAAGCWVVFGLAGSAIAAVLPKAMSDAEVLRHLHPGQRL